MVPARRSPPTNQRLPRPRPPGRVSDPLAEVSDAELLAFSNGRQEFLRRETPEGGLGPIFNHVSCAACHFQGGLGGAGPINVTRFGRNTAAGFDPLASLGGSLLQVMSIVPAAREFIPREANVQARRQTTALFGLGLIEAIPDEALLALAAVEKPDGVRGKAHLVTDIVSGELRVGRFGWKSQQATVLAFSADAYVNEMGVTNRFFPEENAPNGRADLLAQHDRVADPEDTADPVTGLADIDHSANFMRFLAPPAPLPSTAGSEAGKALFTTVGCALCHVPELTTGPNASAALANKTVALYSDLLLHDMGRLGDGIVQGQASGRDMRTAPLWGIRFSAPYLHDGRAPNLQAAIMGHDGEGSVARDRFAKLSAADRAALLQFVQSL